MDASDVAAIVAALAAVLATAFAGVEVRRSTMERQDARAAERNGVAVAWAPAIRPNHSDQDGRATWVYEIVVQNPGHLPVRDVRVTVVFGVEVRRLHYDGALDEPSSTMHLTTPVVLGGGTRTWRRTVTLPFDDRDQLTSTTASVSFTPADSPRQTNYMDGRPPDLAPR